MRVAFLYSPSSSHRPPRMLEQTINWTQMAGTILEGAVLLRILSLRLQNLYTYITLYWAVNLIFDIAAWSFGWKGIITSRIAIYEHMLLAAVLPFAVWDAFEEFLPTISKVRRVLLPKLFSGIFIALLLGVVLAASIDDQVENGPTGTEIFGIYFWLGSTLASLIFVWGVMRAAKTQNFVFPANTRLWALFFLLTLMLSVLDFLTDLSGALLGMTFFQSVQLVLLIVDLGLAVWCILKLRGPQAKANNSAPQSA